MKKKDVFSYLISSRLEDLELSIQKGIIDVNAVDDMNRSLLINSVIRLNIDYVKILIKNGANINHQDKNGWTALHFAAQDYKPEMANVLIESEADIEAVDIYGNTPLSKAVFHSRERGEIIKLLLKNGANKEHKNNYGVSPLSLAYTIANYNIRQFFE